MTLSHELELTEWLGEGLVRFIARDRFEVDGVPYDWFTSSCSSRLIAYPLECSCSCDQNGRSPGRCGFDYGSDGHFGDEIYVYDAYRWKPGMVYYRPVHTEPYRKAPR